QRVISGPGSHREGPGRGLLGLSRVGPVRGSPLAAGAPGSPSIPTAGGGRMASPPAPGCPPPPVEIRLVNGRELLAARQLATLTASPTPSSAGLLLTRFPTNLLSCDMVGADHVAQSLISRLSNALAASGVSSSSWYRSMPPSAKVLSTLASASAA